MSRATALLKKTDRILKRVGPPVRSVYKRVTTRTGGDQLIGRPASITTADTLLAPQPVVSRLGRNVVGDRSASEEVLSGTAERVADDYALTVSATALTEADLKNQNVTLLFKDSSGAIEIFRITDYEPVGFNGVTVMYLLYIRSTSRP